MVNARLSRDFRLPGEVWNGRAAMMAAGARMGGPRSCRLCRSEMSAGLPWQDAGRFGMMNRGDVEWRGAVSWPFHRLPDGELARGVRGALRGAGGLA